MKTNAAIKDDVLKTDAYAEIPKLATLRELSKEELMRGLFCSRSAELRFTLNVILHLIEVQRRRIHTREAYSSLFEYCTKKLGYSESAANRRIRTARLIRSYPRVYELLRTRQLTLSSACLMAKIIKPENAEQLISRMQGKSQQEAELIVAEYCPESRAPERVTPLYLMAVEQDNKTAEDQKRFKLEFCINKETMEKLQAVQEMMSSSGSDRVGLEQMFEQLLEQYYDRHAPERKQERREARKQKRHLDSSKTDKTKRNRCDCATDLSVKDKSAEKLKKRSRYVAESIKDEVAIRDDKRCTFIAEDGRRCSARRYLEYDHKQGFARGAGNTAGELRLLCAEHNRLEAERLYGEGLMKRYYSRE